MPITRDIYTVGGTGTSTIGVCVRNKFALVIDSGQFPRMAAEVKREIERQLDCTVEMLFNTHYHSDHTFGNQSFDCPIIASRRCQDLMDQCLTSHWSEDNIARAKEEDPKLNDEWRNLVITPPTMTFEDELEYDFHERAFIFRRFGGHSPDSSVLFVPDDNIMFVGDIVFAERYPTLLAHDGDPRRLVEVLEKLLLFEIERFIPGHGPVCGPDTLRASIDYWRCLLTICGEARREGLSGEKSTAKLMDACHLPGIRFDESRHRRNIISVLHYLAHEGTLSS